MVEKETTIGGFVISRRYRHIAKYQSGAFYRANGQEERKEVAKEKVSVLHTSIFPPDYTTLRRPCQNEEIGIITLW